MKLSAFSALESSTCRPVARTECGLRASRADQHTEVILAGRYLKLIRIVVRGFERGICLLTVFEI
jgi:hypothetical protein